MMTNYLRIYCQKQSQVHKNGEVLITRKNTNSKTLNYGEPFAPHSFDLTDNDKGAVWPSL